MTLGRGMQERLDAEREQRHLPGDQHDHEDDDGRRSSHGPPSGSSATLGHDNPSARTRSASVVPRTSSVALVLAERFADAG